MKNEVVKGRNGVRAERLCANIEGDFVLLTPSKFERIIISDQKRSKNPGRNGKAFDVNRSVLSPDDELALD